MKGPAPLIEEHYHIQDLIAAQEVRAADRENYRQRERARASNVDEVKEAKSKDLKPFWCSRCKEDFMAESIKEVETDWNRNGYIAFYKSKHWCGAWCIRLITDRHKDGYWVRSRAVAMDKGKHYQDTLQPHETGFNMLYKKI